MYRIFPSIDASQELGDRVAEDIDKLVEWACSQGWEIRVDSKGYRRFYRPDGAYVGYYPATPSNPRRRLADIIAAVRRNGLGWPPPSKKERRAQHRKEAR